MTLKPDAEITFICLKCGKIGEPLHGCCRVCGGVMCARLERVTWRFEHD